jgi:hypothetical protein
MNGCLKVATEDENGNDNQTSEYLSGNDSLEQVCEMDRLSESERVLGGNG